MQTSPDITLITGKCTNCDMNYNVDVQVEIQLGDNVKYEFDHDTNTLRVDRFIQSPVYYFFNYGFITNTLGGDGDPLDAVVLCDQKLHQTAYIQCRMIGVLYTKDEKGEDDKIIVVPSETVDPSNKDTTDITDIKVPTIKKLQQFFSEYKKLEPKKWTIVSKDVGDKNCAYDVYIDAVNKYKQHKNAITDTDDINNLHDKSLK